LKELRTIRLLLPLLRNYRWALPTMIVLGTLSSLADGIGISLFVPLLEGLDPKNNAGGGAGWVQNVIAAALAHLPAGNRLFMIVGAIFVMTICKAVLTYSDSVVAAFVNSRITHSIRSQIFSRVMVLSQTELEQMESGRLLNLLGVDTWRTSDALGLLVSLSVNLCSIGVFSMLLLAISWQLTLVVIVGVALISMLLQMISLGARTLGREGVEANATLSEQMLDGLHGIEVVQMFGLRDLRQRLFDSVSDRVRSIYFRLDLLHRAGPPVSEILYVGLLLAILLTGMGLRHSLPAVMIFLLLLYRLQPQIRQFDSARLTLNVLTSSVEDTTRFLKAPAQLPGRHTITHLGKPAPELRFEGVRFSYDSEAGFALNGASFRVPAGKTTAIVGPSGSGKTTIIGLLCGFREPFAGEILVNGRPLSSFNVEEWRSQIAWAGQDSYLFNATIRENIRYGNIDADESQLMAAAIQADADDFIRGLPEGYDTKVGNEGVPLSGGQTQRLALARALLRGSSVLILDEATSALDSISEESIQNHLLDTPGSRTLIVISHRLSSVKYADHIVVLSKGRVIEEGSPPELFSRRGLLSRLQELQSVK
jgi:ABC-type multidrug transport system fused ATPase/permease subunit